MRCFVVYLSLAIFSLSLPSWASGIEPACKHLTASANTEYYPYSWQSTINPETMQGAMVELTKRIGEEAGLDIEIKYVGPWARTQKEAFSGHIDLIAGAFYTDERTKVVDYLYPELTKTQTVIWVNQQQSFVYQQLSDLKGKIGGTIINNSLGQKFDDYASKHLQLYELSGIEQGFKMLDAKRLDYVIYEREPSAFAIDRLNINSLTYLQPAISQEGLHLVISKASPCNTPEVQERLTQALHKAKEQHWDAIYLKQAKDVRPTLINVRD